VRVDIDDELVGRLIEAQFPDWSGLPLRRLPQAGSDNVIYRLGPDLAVRLPRGDWAAWQARKEFRWLPGLAPLLPLGIPEPVAVGEPGCGYPWSWSVARWRDGDPVLAEHFGDSESAARDLAGFLQALWRLPVPEAISPGPHPELQRRTLADRDAAVRRSIAAISDEFDSDVLTRVWERALAAPPWPAEAVWVHGDFHTGNLLARDGRVTAVLDFGGLGRGDPACDLDVAYTLMTERTRAVFRDELGLDAHTWDRGRGWSLAGGVNAHAAYARTEPRVVAQTRRQIAAVIAEDALV
jgi:aminoglycoside phosphotransferase (APT) family kinase protein